MLRQLHGTPGDICISAIGVEERMTEEKRRKKLGLSLKTSKKTIAGCNEDPRTSSRQLIKNIRHAKPKINAHSKSVVIDVHDDFNDLDAEQSKLIHKIETKTDSNQCEKET